MLKIEFETAKLFRPIYHKRLESCTSIAEQIVISNTEDCRNVSSHIDYKDRVQDFDFDQPVESNDENDVLCAQPLVYNHFTDWNIALRYLKCIKSEAHKQVRSVNS